MAPRDRLCPHSLLSLHKSSQELCRCSVLTLPASEVTENNTPCFKARSVITLLQTGKSFLTRDASSSPLVHFAALHHSWLTEQDPSTRHRPVATGEGSGVPIASPVTHRDRHRGFAEAPTDPPELLNWWIHSCGALHRGYPIPAFTKFMYREKEMSPRYSCKQQKCLPCHKSQHFPFPWPTSAIMCTDQWGKIYIYFLMKMS